jgi:predicted homoserine dehydrogenase-like protein
VGYSIHILNFNNKICRHILQKTICHTSKELLHAEGYSFSDEDTKILRNGVVAYIEKDFHNFINSSGVKVVYADGTRGNKNMKIYKDKYYKNIIKYSPYTSISLEDYLTLRNSCVIV